MKWLDTQTRVLFFFALFYVYDICSMEIRNLQQNSRVKSLRDICIQSLACRAEETGMISNLIYLPTDCAIDIILSMQNIWRIRNRAKLLEFARWRKDVMCAVVERTNDTKLAYGLAEL